MKHDWTLRDEELMRRALFLAAKGKGWVSPNPLVGCVIARKGRIVSEGFHEQCGKPHAEINALSSINGDAKELTMYVTLEPCATQGKTPPCTDSIVRAGITRVVIGSTDPNPKNHEHGIKALRDAGIEVQVGLLRDLVAEQNAYFFKFARKKLPYVILKMAQSLDGKIANNKGESKWITSEPARRFTHTLRAQVDAVLVGTATMLKDDPELTARLPHGHVRQPTRVILDRELKIPARRKVFLMSRVPNIVVTKGRITHWQERRYKKVRSCDVIRVPLKGDQIDMAVMLKRLADRNISSILVEGGGELAASLLTAHLVDKVYFFIAPKIIGGKDSVTSVEGEGVNSLNHAIRISDVRTSKVGDDLLVEGKVGRRG